MRIDFVVGHPAHVHLFRNAIGELRARGHAVSVGAVEKESTMALLAAYGMDYVRLGQNVPSMLGKALDMPRKDLRFLRWMGDTMADMVVSTGSPYAAQASSIRGIPHIAFSDTEIAVVVLNLMVPFTDAICTPSAFTSDLGAKQVRYPSYHELAYLHPTRFQPDPSVLTSVDAGPSDRLIVLRFSSSDSSHDLDHRSKPGSDFSDIVHVVRALQRFGKVVITSERPLPPELEGLIGHIPVHKMHDLLSFAALYIGEGATMASEAGVLGVPWIFVSASNRGYLRDQELRYGLGVREQTWGSALSRAIAWIDSPDLRSRWAEKRRRLLGEKIDLTSFIVRFIENWPESLRDMCPSPAQRSETGPTGSRGGS